MVGYRHFLLSRKYIQALFPKPRGYTFVCDDIVYGGFVFFQTVFPFRIEVVVSEKLPVVHTDLPRRKGLTLTLWHRIKESNEQKDTQKITNFFQATRLCASRRAPVAYIDISATTKETYFSNWSSSLKHHRNKWYREHAEGVTYSEISSINDFVVWYRKSDIRNNLKDFYISQMYYLKKEYADDMTFYLVFRMEKVVAGVCIIDDIETRQIIYQYMFCDKTKDNKHIGTGIIDLCINKTFEREYQYLGLTAIYEKGQPKSWKGLTKFKNQFHPKVTCFFNVYFRFGIHF